MYHIKIMKEILSKMEKFLEKANLKLTQEEIENPNVL